MIIFHTFIQFTAYLITYYKLYKSIENLIRMERLSSCLVCDLKWLASGIFSKQSSVWWYTSLSIYPCHRGQPPARRNCLCRTSGSGSMRRRHHYHRYYLIFLSNLIKSQSGPLLIHNEGRHHQPLVPVLQQLRLGLAGFELVFCPLSVVCPVSVRLDCQITIRSQGPPTCNLVQTWPWSASPRRASTACPPPAGRSSPCRLSSSCGQCRPRLLTRIYW